MKMAMLGYGSTLLYLITMVLLVVNLRHAPSAQRLRTVDSIPAIFAILLHGLLLYSLIVTSSGINLAFFNSLNLMAWLITVILLVSSLHLPIISLGILMFPLNALFIALSLIFHKGPGHILEHTSTPIALHIVLSMIAYGVLSLCSLQGIVLYIQDWRLHHHKQTTLSTALPPLQKMESILFTLLATGFILLTTSLISGLMFVERFFTHKIILSLIAWLVFGILLIGRWLMGWRGRLAIRLTMLGITSLLLAVFGSKLVLELILGR